MKLPILLVVGIVIVSVALTVYVTKHYTLNKLSVNTGVDKATIQAASEAKP